MHRAVGSAVAIVALIVLGVGVLQYRALHPSGRDVATARAAPSPPPKLGFIRLDAPRELPPLHFAEAEGNAMSPADFRGRTVLLNMWATWCVPCREEMPALDRLQAELGGPDFEVAALSIDRGGLPVVEAFFRDIELKTLGIYIDPSGKAARDLNIVGLPTTLLIDRGGNETGRLVGPAEWDSPEAFALIKQAMNPSPTADAAGARLGTQER